MVSSGRLASALALLASIGCHAAPSSPATLAGCWAFERRDGAQAPLGAEMPDTIRLESQPNLNPDGRPHPFLPLRLEVLSHRVGALRDTIHLDATHDAPWPPDWDHQYALTAWRFSPPDSLLVVFHANMAQSWALRLVAADDSLGGEAEEYSDAIPPKPRIIRVVAHRAACHARPAPSI